MIHINGDLYTMNKLLKQMAAEQKSNSLHLDSLAVC